MKSFLVRLNSLATLVALFWSAPGHAQTDRHDIERLTNLSYYDVIDTCCDYFGEDHWSFSKAARRMDLMTHTYDVRSTSTGISTKWLADHARRGRVHRLGRPDWWATPPALPAFTLSEDPDANWIVMTDLEPDDRVALMYLSRRLPFDKVLAVGANLLNSGARAGHTRRLLDHLGWSKVPVLQGNGGAPESYPEFASNAAAKAFSAAREPAPTSIELTMGAAPQTSRDDLQAFIYAAMTRATAEKKKLNFLILSPGTDLANALLSASPAAVDAINRVVMTGGWVEGDSAGGGRELRSTYNMNMDLLAARVIFERLNIELVSSHVIKPTFGGGSINAQTAPRVARAFNEGTHPALVETRAAGLQWDRHLIKAIPPLAAVVGPFAGQQFTPADVVAAALVINPALATRVDDQYAVHLQLDQTNGKGALVNLRVPAPGTPRTRVVEGVNGEHFLEDLADALEHLGCESALL